MSDSEESLIRAINHYQSGLERYMQRQDETKMLHNLGRLYKLPIKVSHLEKTGIGRTVNSLRKLDGAVGDFAKSLVAKWKEMVVQEEDTKTDVSTGEENQEAVPNQVELEEKHYSSPKNESDRNRSSDKHERKSSEKRHKSKSKEHSKSESKENRNKGHSKRSHSISEDSNEDLKNVDSDSCQSNSKRKSDREEKKNHTENKSTKVNYQSKGETKQKSKHSTEDEESEQELHKPKHKNFDKTDSVDKKHKHKSSHDSMAEKYKSRDTHADKHKSREDKKHEYSKHEKEKKKHKHSEKKEEKHENQKKENHEREDHNSSGKSQGSSSSKKDKNSERSNSSKSVLYSAVINGIGSESGTSFADALGMCEPPPTKKKKLVQNEKHSAPSPVYEEKAPIIELPLPKEPLENLDINMSTLLPPITPHYRPLGLPICEQSKKILTDDEALSRVMLNKNQRTKVFSGNKVGLGKVPSLFDICVRILQDNIDALEYTGGVPYSILKPILEKATANQLYMMEHHNPYLIEDSDELWKLHCQKEFRNKQREELETWRDMYMRCLDEREAKLKALTANIKQSQDKSIPVRTTKLAYVDSVAKPPRNIARKQAKNDTGCVRPSPSSKLATLATKGEASKVVVPNPGSRAAERSASGPSHHSVKVKKAPLMAKTLSLFKNRFKR